MILIPPERLPVVPTTPDNPALAAIARELLWSLNRIELLASHDRRCSAERN